MSRRTLKHIHTRSHSHTITRLHTRTFQASIDKWLELGAVLEAAALAWVEPFASKADDEVRGARPGTV